MLGGGLAHAACDDDGDGYDDVDTGDTGCGDDLDCDGTDDTVNPGVAETLDDGVDNDCDGLVDMLRRPYFRGWWVAGKGWSTAGSGTFFNDTVAFGTSYGHVQRDIDTTDYLVWDEGSLFVTVAMDHPGNAGGGDCKLEIDATDATSTSRSQTITLNTSSTDNGVTVAEFDDSTSTGLGPRPIEISRLRVKCAAGSDTKSLDWIALSNGDYGLSGSFPPVTDVRLDFATMSAPFGGQGTTVVYGYDLGSQTDLPKRLILGTDNGGAAMTRLESTKDFYWDTINGGGRQLTDDADYAIWGVWASGPTDIFTLSGHHKGDQGRIQGRTRHGNGNNEVWTEITPYYDDDRTDAGDLPHIGAYGAADPWNWTLLNEAQQRADGGGSLMLRWHADNDDLLVANHYTAGLDSDEMGVFVIDVDTATDCEHGTPFTGLPDAPDFESKDTETDGLISALAVARDDAEDWWLFVGYKLRPENDNALFECELPATTTSACHETTTLSCTEIDDTGWDIRDIVVVDNVLFIADAGRRWKDSGGGDLDDEDPDQEAQVFAYDFHADTVLQLDETTNSAPVDTGMAWDEPADTGLGYPDFDGTLQGTGNLRPPASGELTALAISPVVGDEETRYLFAFFDAGRSQEAYQTPVVWRAQIAGDEKVASEYLDEVIGCDASSPPVCKAAWVPMYDYSGALHTGSSQDNWDTNKTERTDAVEAQATTNWHVTDQEIDYGWYPSSAVDAIFMDLNGYKTLVVAGGVGVYHLGPENTAGSPQVPGWDTAYKKSTEDLADDDLDLDALPWGYANDNASDFQQTVATDIAWCSDCTSSLHPDTDPSEVTTDGQGWFGAWDLGLGRIWGMPASGARPRAVVDCQLDVLRSPSRVVEYWSDGTDSVLLAGLWSQTGTYDRGGILRSENEGETFCYEMSYDRSDEIGDRGSNPAWISGSDELLCREGASLPAWDACEAGDTLTAGALWSPNEDASPGSAPLGSTTGLAIARKDLAFALTYDPVGDDTALGALVVLDGETGLLAELAGNDRILVDSTTSGSPTADCTGLSWDDIFDSYGLFVRISPADQEPNESACETNGGCDLIVGFNSVDDGTSDGSANCSLFHVNVTHDGTDWASTWQTLVLDEETDDPDDYCDIEYDRLTDAVIPPWDPDTAYVVGNSHGSANQGGMCAFDLTDNSYAGQIVAADRHYANIDSIIAHPHIQDVLFFGSYRGYTPASYSDAPGVYVVSKGVGHVNASETWATGEISVTGLTHPSFLDLALGEISGTVEYLFGATGGSGPVEGLFCQEGQEDCE